MIKKLIDTPALDNLKYTDIYGGKIKTLYKAYGNNYDFCGFFEQDNRLLFSKLDRDFIIGEPSGEFNAEELAEYLKACRATSVFLSENVLKAIEPFISGEYLYNHLMEYVGDFPESKEIILDENPRLDDVYEILRHDFNIIHDSWLTDVSHRVRHGISRVIMYNSVSTVTVLYDEDNVVFLTQVATLAAARGQGAATTMLRALAERHTGKRVLLVCRDKMLGFYEKVGFKRIDSAAQIYRLDI